MMWKLVLFAVMLLGCYFEFIQTATTVSVSPTLNSEDVQFINNATNTVVTTFTDLQYVFLRYNVSGVGIRIYDLRACDSANCSTANNVQLLDSNGCPVVYPSFGSIIPGGFVRDPVNRNIYETPAFRMFRWLNGQGLYLNGKKAKCNDNSTACTDFCSTAGARKTREAPTEYPTGRHGVVGEKGMRSALVFFNDLDWVDNGVVIEIPVNMDRPGQDINMDELSNWHRHICPLDDNTVREVLLLGILATISAGLAVSLTFRVHSFKSK